MSDGVPIPVTVVTGFLGTGKTTAIRALLRHAPAGARWAVLVNEFGDVDIDGAVLQDGDLEVRTVAGGCICCATALPFRVALVRLIREVRPDRVIIEPSGLADPSSLLDTLRGPGLREVVSTRATIGLVHPLRFFDPRFSDHPVYRSQITVADVLVAGFADTSKSEDLDRFIAAAEQLDPPKYAVATAAQGELDPAWLDLDPAPPRPVRTGPGDLRWVLAAAEPPNHGFVGNGWRWPPTIHFDRSRLEAALMTLVAPGGPLPAGATRLKGIFRTPGRWLRVDADHDRIAWRPVPWRRDSRVQIIAPAQEPPDWRAAEDLLAEAALEPSAAKPVNEP